MLFFNSTSLLNRSDQLLNHETAKRKEKFDKIKVSYNYSNQKKVAKNKRSQRLSAREGKKPTTLKIILLKKDLHYRNVCKPG